MKDLPLGFAMSLAQNGAALDYFSALTEEEKQAVIAHTHQLRSKQEMRAYAEQLSKREQP